MTVEDNTLVLRPVRHAPRQGWAESGRHLAETQGNELVWPGFEPRKMNSGNGEARRNLTRHAESSQRQRNSHNMATGNRPAPFHTQVPFRGKTGPILLGQLRGLDKRRLAEPLGATRNKTVDKALGILQDMFAP